MEPEPSASSPRIGAHRPSGSPQRQARPSIQLQAQSAYEQLQNEDGTLNMQNLDKLLSQLDLKNSDYQQVGRLNSACST